MSDPVLYQEKLLKPTVLTLEKGADQEDEALRVLSLRALGNMALGAPKKVLLLTLSPGARCAGPGGLRVRCWQTRRGLKLLAVPPSPR